MQQYESLLSFCPGEPGQEIDWERIEASRLNSCFKQMADTPQDPVWHGEGDVLAHTKLVCKHLVSLEGFWKLEQCRRQELFVAGLLHDIGKNSTTRYEDGSLKSPRHGPVGAQLARVLLWQEFGMSGTTEAQRIRETICLLIRYHTAPINAMKRDDTELFLRRIAANGKLANDFTIEMLCLLSEADALGRVAYDVQDICDAVHLCAMQAKEAGCLCGPYAFPDAYTAYAYLAGRRVSPEYSLYDDCWGEITMLCGLPGTGKDTWIRRERPDMPVVSLDDIRCEKDVKPTDAQGVVIQAAKEQAKKYLRTHQPFIYNATNVSERTRSQWIALFEKYKAKVRIVFLETGWEEGLRRNAQRADAVPESVIGDMLSKLTLPEMREAYAIEWRTV